MHNVCRKCQTNEPANDTAWCSTCYQPPTWLDRHIVRSGESLAVVA